MTEQEKDKGMKNKGSQNQLDLILNRIQRICEKGINWISIGIFTLLLVINFFFQTKMPMTRDEIATISHLPFDFYLLLFVFLVFSFFASKIIMRLKESLLFSVGVAVYLFFATIFILHTSNLLRSDAEQVYYAASVIQFGDISHLTSFMKGQYLYVYPHQLGLVTFEKTIFSIFQSTSTRLLFTLNLFMILVINFFLWRLSRLLFNNKSISKMTIILSFLFLPQFFFIFFVYGVIPGMFFGIIGLFFLIKYIRQKGIINALIAVITLALADFVRNNFIILLMGVFVFSVLYALRKRLYKPLLLSITTLLLANYLSAWNKTYYEDLVNTKLVGEPKIAWIAMGINDSESNKKIGGWYDFYVMHVYDDGKGDPQEITKRSQATINTRIKYFLTHPLYTIKYFGRKITSTWSDGTYQSIWSGPLKDNKQPVETQLLKSIYEGGTLFDQIYRFSHIIVIILFFGAFYGVKTLIKNRKTDIYLETIPLTLYFIGGFIFHLFWETKSQYAYPYVVFIIPVAAYGLYEFRSFIDQKFQKR